MLEVTLATQFQIRSRCVAAPATGVLRASQCSFRAIEKATNQAYLNINPIKLGCGSWECRCDQKHSVPFKVRGKGGSVTIEIIPAPRGLGLVAGGKIKRLLQLAGLKDAWTTAKGSTPTMNSTSKAILDCLRQTFSQG